MKKFLLFIVLTFFTIYYTHAQQVGRDKVILEIGTGTWCQFCPGAAMGADDLIANGYEVAVVEYHNGDSYANTYSNSRISYYNVTGFPTAYFDGGNAVVGGSTTQSMFPYYSPKVNQRMAVPSSFTIDLAGSHFCLKDFNVDIEVDKVATNSSSNLKLHVVLTESHIEESWFGMNEVNYVCRKMYPNQNGTSISFSGGNTQTVNIQFSLDPSYIIENCELVVFLQDASTKEIFQGTKKALLEFPPENDYDVFVKSVSNLPETNCSGSLEPKILIRNIGAQTLSNTEIHFYANNGEIQTYTWNGSLEYLDAEEVVLPGMNFTVEEDNEIVICSVNPNGNPDQCSDNDTIKTIIPEAMHTPNTVKLILRTDANPQETTWEILDPGGVVLYSGGPYSTSGTMIQETFELALEDCYTFNIYDSGGDGLVNPGFFMLYHGTSTSICQGTVFGSYKTAQFNTTDVVGIEENITVSSVQVYPNPFSDITNISLELANPSIVRIKVYNLAGQMVIDMDEGNLAKGSSNISLDGSKLNPGLYLYNIQIGDEFRTGKITVKR